MLGRIVLILIQFSIAWRLAPEIKRYLPPMGALEIFALAVIFALLVWFVGALGHLVLKDVTQPSPSTLLFAVVSALAFAALTLVPDVTQAIARVLPRIDLYLSPLAGAVLGSLRGMAGAGIPWAELLAALAVSAVGLLLVRHQQGRTPSAGLAGGVVLAAVAVHALLHGQEAPSGAPAWWLGAALTSAALVLGGFLLTRRLSPGMTARFALLLCLAGGVLALVPAT